MFAGEQLVCIRESGKIEFRTFYELSKKGDKSEWEVFSDNGKFIKAKLKIMAKHKMMKVSTHKESFVICVHNDVYTSDGNINIDNLNIGRYLLLWLDTSSKHNESDLIPKNLECAERNLIPIISIEPFETEYNNSYSFTLLKDEQYIVLPTLKLSESKNDWYAGEKLKAKESGIDRCLRGIITLL